jgi:hypothetical protein
MSIREIVPKDRGAEHIDLIRRLHNGETINSFEAQGLNRDGRVPDIWLTAILFLTKT